MSTVLNLDVKLCPTVVCLLKKDGKERKKELVLNGFIKTQFRFLTIDAKLLALFT